MAVPDPGSLNHRIDLMQKIETPDGEGGLVVSWSLVDSVWARIVLRNAQSSELGQQQQERVRHSITIRAHASVQSGWRAISGTRTFEILNVIDPDESGRFLTLETVEIGR